ncbi:uncharacterized protein [Eurosta solidaginis]|uniref:uncharacterized protein n=1 Tax=Eurosta solidaginis TaxID=178769 RepID=UPI003530BDAA
MSNFRKMFNSETNTGRANVAKATYGTLALLYIIHRLRKRSTKSSCPECGCQNCASSHAPAGETAVAGESEPATAAAAGEEAKTETHCDTEVWKHAIYGDKPDGNVNGGEKEVKEAQHVSYKTEKGVDLRTANMGNAGKK